MFFGLEAILKWRKWKSTTLRFQWVLIVRLPCCQLFWAPWLWGVGIQLWEPSPWWQVSSPCTTLCFHHSKTFPVWDSPKKEDRGKAEDLSGKRRTCQNDISRGFLCNFLSSLAIFPEIYFIFSFKFVSIFYDHLQIKLIIVGLSHYSPPPPSLVVR